MPERSTRLPPACCRSRSAKRPRPFPMCMDGAKIYRFTVTWGAGANTDDLEGVVTQDVGQAAVARGDTARSCRTIPARSSRCRRIFGHQDQWRARLQPRARRRDGRDRGAHGRYLPARPCRDARRRRGGVRVRMRQGHLCALAGARHRVASSAAYGHITQLRRTAVDPFTADDLVPLDGSCVALEGDLGRARRRKSSPTGAALERAARRCRSHARTQAQRIRSGNPVLLRGRDAPTHADEAFATRGQRPGCHRPCGKGRVPPAAGCLRRRGSDPGRRQGCTNCWHLA